MISQKVQVAYSNRSPVYQILRIPDRRCYIERAIAPMQEIVFEAFTDATVEIFTAEFVGALLASKTLVANLQKFKMQSCKL